MCFVDDIQLTIPICVVHNIVVQCIVLFGFCVSRLGIYNERECYAYIYILLTGIDPMMIG
jgi:hypothetical protein